MKPTPASLMQQALVSLLVLAIIALAVFAFSPAPYISLLFFKYQDIPAALILVVFSIVLRVALPRLAQLNLAATLPRIDNWKTVAAIAFAVFVIGAAGSYLVFQSYPLSMDEFWARADGRIFAHGTPLAHVPAEWLPYASALAPTFLHLLPKAGLWSSNYLPVNALIQLAFGPFASPLLAAISVLLVALIARRLMPEHRHAPLICALLLASSTQLLVTAMTPYAMTAHLAFNLAWLWLFLKRNPAAQLGAMIVGFLATGLHQFAFFPLFALPFLAESFLSGRRGWAVTQGLVVVLGALAWSNYDSFTAAWMGVTPAAGAVRDSGKLLGRLLEMILRFDVRGVGLMALNLLRFQLWQNPIAVPLMFLAAWKVFRLSGPMRAALGGIVLTAGFVLFVLPFQGHGWGYRYLHGLLGNLSLLATYGWYQIADRKGGEWRAVFASMLAFSLVVLLPLRAYQAWHWTAPYVAANSALKHVDANIVVIDAPNHAYSQDLVRNSPLLDNAPKRMAAFNLGKGPLEQLCKRYRVAFFTDSDAARFGIPKYGGEPQNPVFPAARCRN